MPLLPIRIEKVAELVYVRFMQKLPPIPIEPFLTSQFWMEATCFMKGATITALINWHAMGCPYNGLNSNLARLCNISDATYYKHEKALKEAIAGLKRAIEEKQALSPVISDKELKRRKECSERMKIQAAKNNAARRQLKTMVDQNKADTFSILPQKAEKNPVSDKPMKTNEVTRKWIIHRQKKLAQTTFKPTMKDL